MPENVYLKDEIVSSLNVISEFIDKSLDNLGPGYLSSISGNPSVGTSVQFFNKFKLNDDLQRSLLGVIFNHAMMAERVSPGSFEMTLRLVSDSIRRGGEVKINNNSIAKKPTLSDLRTIIDRVSNNKNISQIVCDALELAGYGGRIVVEKSSSDVSSVELCNGYTFECRPAWKLVAKFENVRTCVIDGYVESVSEIHHLLQVSSEKKEPLALFTRGASNDVIHTLKVNYDRGSLRVIPLIVNFDLEGINTVNDISVVTGADLVSSNRGDLISSIKYEEMPIVDSITTHPNKVTVKNSGTRSAVNLQVRRLLEKSMESAAADVSELYHKRIRSLSPNHVTIRIPDNKDYVKDAQAIDNCLRIARTLSDHGTHDSGGGPAPAGAHVVSAAYATKCVVTLRSLGAITLPTTNTV